MAKRQIKFTVNVHYKGKLVGPDTEFETMEVGDYWADYFVKHNAAEEIAVIEKNQQPGKATDLAKIVETPKQN